MDSLFDAGIVLSLESKSLIIKLFCDKDELVTDALRTHCKRTEEEKKLISLSGTLKLVKFFKEKSRSQDRPLRGKSFLREERVSAVQ